MNCFLPFVILLCLAQGYFQCSVRMTGQVIPESRSNFRLSSLTWTPSLTSRSSRLLCHTQSNPGVVSMICCTCSIHLLSLMILPLLRIFIASSNMRFQTRCVRAVARHCGVRVCRLLGVQVWRLFVPCDNAERIFMAQCNEPTRVRCNLELQRHRNWTPHCVRM